MFKFWKSAKAANETKRAQWAAAKAVALASGNAALIASYAQAEQYAHDAMVETYGRAALVHASGSLLDELCAIALVSIPHSVRHAARPALASTPVIHTEMEVTQ